VTAVKVWAPAVGVVELELDSRRVPMRQAADGWWAIEIGTPQGPGDYRFRIDGSGPLPDPRSGWQPSGVHGPSRLVDHGSFTWTDVTWHSPPLSSGVVYELHVGTFTKEGTFEAVIARLPHLVTLGVSHVELMPVAEFPGRRGWGYDGVDLYAPHHAYGGPVGLKRLVDACHAHGLAVVLDVVYNHLGPSGNYLNRFGPYFTERYVTPWGPAVNLDGADSDDVRRFFLDNALMWFRDYHMDGLRIDAVHAIFDASALHFLEQLAGDVRRLESRLGRHLAVIAESDLNDPRIVRSPAGGGYGLDAQWNEDFHHALHVVLTGERTGYYRDFAGIADLAKALRSPFVYDGRYSAYRRRRHGRPASDLTGHRFIGFLQNHDQIGNRAQGERSCHLMGLGRAKIGAALVLTAPFVPMLFQGEEWGATTPFQYFTDHEEPELGRAVSEGRRREFTAFGWDPARIPDPQAAETFERCRLDWTEVDRDPHRELLGWHRALIALRRNTPALTDGALADVRVTFDERAQWLSVQRGSVIVAVNLGPGAVRVPLDAAPERRLLLASDPAIRVRSNQVELPPDTVAVMG
jgi:maltooligosyltrehalose trehalohydrolase